MMIDSYRMAIKIKSFIDNNKIDKVREIINGYKYDVKTLDGEIMTAIEYAFYYASKIDINILMTLVEYYSIPKSVIELMASDCHIDILIWMYNMIPQFPVNSVYEQIRDERFKLRLNLVATSGIKHDMYVEKFSNYTKCLEFLEEVK